MALVYDMRKNRKICIGNLYNPQRVKEIAVTVIVTAILKKGFYFAFER